MLAVATPYGLLIIAEWELCCDGIITFANMQGDSIWKLYLLKQRFCISAFKAGEIKILMNNIRYGLKIAFALHTPKDLHWWPEVFKRSVIVAMMPCSINWDELV